MAEKRALVTGASSGIGAAVCNLLAAGGWRLVGSGRRPECLAVSPAGVLESAIVRDLTEPGAPEEVVGKAVAALGGLDLVVSCAGTGWLGPFFTMSPSEIDLLLDINLRVPLHLAHAAAPHLLASGGQLVMIGSIAGLVGVADEVAYATSKAGLRGLAESLRLEWSKQWSQGWPAGVSGVVGDRSCRLAISRPTVTLVSPGAVDTPFFSRRNLPYMHSWPRPMPVGRVAKRIVRAIERRQEDVVVPAWLLYVARFNGGFPSLYRFLSTWPRRRPHALSG